MSFFIIVLSTIVGATAALIVGAVALFAIDYWVERERIKDLNK